MDANVIKELQNGLNAAYINGSVAVNLAYKPAFVSNNPEEGKKVISSVEDELLRCDQFQISVAFITMGGVTPLLQTLKELEKKGVKGQILTTNYLNFSEPRALEKLNGLKNITLKMYDVEATGNGFHTKGYIFKKEEIYRIIIGSSNMTSAALTVNKEWNTKLISTENGEVAEETARGYGELKGGWEFPGGKIEAGETPQEALKREIMEELDTEIKVGDLIDTIEYDYPTFHLSMDCFWAEVTAGHLELKEAEAAKWLTKDQLDCVAWLPADVTLIEKIRRNMEN